MAVVTCDFQTLIMEQVQVTTGLLARGNLYIFPLWYFRTGDGNLYTPLNY